MNIAEEASLIRQLEEARAIINQRNGEILHLQREAARYREQRDSANAMVKFLRGLFENSSKATQSAASGRTIVHSSTFQMQTGRTAPGRNAPRLSMHQPYLPTAAACRPAAWNTRPCCKRPSRPSVHAPAPSLSSLKGIPLHAKACSLCAAGRALLEVAGSPGIRCRSNRAIDD